VAAIAGHSKTSTTTDVYGHLLSGRVQEAALRFDPSLSTSHSFPTRPTETSSNVVDLTVGEGAESQQTRDLG